MTSKRRKKTRGRVASAICHLFGCIILIVVIGSVVPMTVPKLMGYDVYNVVSGSMEPTIPVGSISYVKAVDPVTLQKGDIIAFTSGGSVIMHRVSENHALEDYLVTKGDANEQEDIGEVPYQNVHGKVVKHFPMLGQLMMIYSSMVGKVLLLCLAFCGALLNMLAGRYKEVKD